LINEDYPKKKLILVIMSLSRYELTGVIASNLHRLC